jgi:hypothetical protein
MTSFETVLVGLIIVGCAVGFFWREGKGILQFWFSMHFRQIELQRRMRENISLHETQAIEALLEVCSHYQKDKFEDEGDLEFSSTTFCLINRIAGIYYPEENEPVYKARIGDVLSAFQQMNQKILVMMETSDLKALTQFRLSEVMSRSKVKNNSSFVPAFIVRRLRLIVLKALWIQWLLLVGESAMKVYGDQKADEIPEPESLLDEMDQLKEESDLSLPDEVREIVESSRKKILFALKPLSWEDAKTLYVLLTENIAEAWHPESPDPLYEMRVYDLLKSLASYLEWAGQLNHKPVLNKMLGLRLSPLKGVKEVALPFTDNKLFDWLQKYQVGRAAKWSKTIFKTLQKKQPAILFRDVAMGVVKEGGKRWLILILHDKIAEESNKLYKTS